MKQVGRWEQEQSQIISKKLKTNLSEDWLKSVSIKQLKRNRNVDRKDWIELLNHIRYYQNETIKFKVTNL